MAKDTSKTSLVLLLMRVVQMALNIVTISLTAKFFGITMERDMWVYTNTLILTTIGMFWGPINEVFRAKFIFIKEDTDEKTALQCTSSLFGFVILTAIVIGLLMLIFSPNLSDLLISDANAKDVFWKILVLLIPTLLIRETTLLLTGLLNAYNIFYIPEYANIVSGFINIGLLVLLAPFIGIYALLVSCYLSLVILLVAVIYFVKRENINIIKGCYKLRSTYILPFLTFSLPLYFPYFIGQFNEIVQNGLAEFLGSGTISVLNYSKQFPIIVQGIMSSVIATVMMPILAKAFKQNNQKEYVQLLNENILLYMAIYGLFACVAIGAASPMCRVLFQYGKMTFEDVDRVISLTRMFTAAFGGVVLYLIFSISLLTTGRNQVYAFIGAFTQIIVLLTNVLLIKKVGVIVFPLSYGIAHLFTALIMFYTLRIEGKSLVAVGICRCLLCIAIATSAFYFANELSCSLSLFLQIITNIVLALIFIPLMLMSMGIDVRKFILYIHSKERA